MPTPAKYLNHPKRLEALASGLTKADYGEPCGRAGHASLRYVKSGCCVACNAMFGAQARQHAHRERGKAKKIIPTKKLIAQRVAEVEMRRESMN
jgi:hypothetical protein